VATITPTQVKSHPIGKRTCRIYKWLGTAAGDTLESVVIAGMSDITVYFLKGAAFGGNAGFEHSPDPANSAGSYVVATDAKDGTPISGKTSDSAIQILTRGYWGRPTVGAGLAAVDVWLVMTSTK
jgi:hypothetical protein